MFEKWRYVLAPRRRLSKNEFFSNLLTQEKAGRSHRWRPVRSNRSVLPRRPCNAQGLCQGQQELYGLFVALLGGLPPPVHCLYGAFIHAFALAVQNAQVELGRGVTVLGGAAPPLIAASVTRACIVCGRVRGFGLHRGKNESLHLAARRRRRQRG